ncbi:MAG: MFS transporter [Rhodothermales bacterium]
MNVLLTSRLSLMMFAQYFIWGAWAPTLGNYMGTIGMGESINWAYSLGPLSAIIAPFFLGMVADRFFDSEKVLGVMCLLAGVAMMAMPSYAGTPLFLPLLFLHAICYFPTLGLTATLAFHHMTNQEKEFPVVRVFGTIGWIVAGVVIGKVLQADATPLPLYIGGAASIFLGVYSFTLPLTPPPSAGQKTSWKQILGVDALRALKTRSFVIFLIAAMLIFIAFGTYFPYAPVYFKALHDNLNLTHFQNPSFEMSFGQASEIVFMLLIPFFFARLGVKWMLMLGMLAWVARFTVFSAAALSGTFWLVMIGILIHGVCYDFFFVTGQIYIDKKTSPEIRGQVQGLLVLLTQGVGFFLGTQISGAFVNTYGAGGTLALPDWRLFWGLFAGATLLFSIAFFMLFDEKAEQADGEAVPQRA